MKEWDRILSFSCHLILVILSFLSYCHFPVHPAGSQVTPRSSQSVTPLKLIEDMQPRASSHCELRKVCHLMSCHHGALSQMLVTCTHVGSPNKIGRIAAGSQSCSSIPSPQCYHKWQPESAFVCVFCTPTMGLLLHSHFAVSFLQETKKHETKKPKKDNKHQQTKKNKIAHRRVGSYQVVVFCFFGLFFCFCLLFFWVSWLFFGSLFIWRAGKTTQGAGPNSLPLLPV